MAASGSIRTLTPAENLQICKELNEGMEAFIRQQKVNEKEAEIELASLLLNA